MKKVNSPNYDERALGTTITYIVLHYTGRPNAEEALKMMCNPEHKASTHYMIDEDGTITSIVDEGHRAWHAGVSYWKGETDINSLSIGIELVNPGHEFGYRPFPDVQIDSLISLMKDILLRTPTIKPPEVLAHSDVAPLRKMDPGELFPWETLAKHGLGVWPEGCEDITEAVTSSTDAALLLSEIGYDCRTDEATNASKIAFLRRYCPNEMDKGFTLTALKRLSLINAKQGISHLP